VSGGLSVFFSPVGVWNAVVPSGAALASDSAALVARLVGWVSSSELAGTGPWINTTDYSSPIYTVPAGQPTVRVLLTSSNRDLLLASEFAAVPVPAGAQPAAGSDGQMVVYQPSSDTMWEMFQAREVNGQWYASWGGEMGDVSSDPGYYRTEQNSAGQLIEEADWGATASSLPMVGGLITLADLASGSIDHAIAMMIPEAEARVHWCPAQRTDGKDTSSDAIPEGAHFRLDPGLNLATLSMPPITREIAVAAQKYGLIVNDQTGATVGFRAQDPTPLIRAGQPNPYLKYFTGANGQYEYPTQFLASFPWSHLQLLAPPTSCS
jgi:hypothetical protein